MNWLVKAFRVLSYTNMIIIEYDYIDHRVRLKRRGFSEGKVLGHLTGVEYVIQCSGRIKWGIPYSFELWINWY